MPKPETPKAPKGTKRGRPDDGSEREHREKPPAPEAKPLCLTENVRLVENKEDEKGTPEEPERTSQPETAAQEDGNPLGALVLTRLIE